MAMPVTAMDCARRRYAAAYGAPALRSLWRIMDKGFGSTAKAHGKEAYRGGLGNDSRYGPFCRCATRLVYFRAFSG